MDGARNVIGKDLGKAQGREMEGSFPVCMRRIRRSLYVEGRRQAVR